MTTDTQQDTPPVTEQPAGTDSSGDGATSASADDTAKKVLAKARYDAFRLVTDAREEAESILDEARAEAAALVHEAEARAEAIIEEARAEVHAAEPPEDPPSTTSAVSDLEAEHNELTERVGSLRALADQLEERFAALAATADAADEPPAKATDTTLDYSPSVPAPERRAIDEDEDEPLAGTERGSFYSRRSAKLPSIGEAGGKSALDMMRSIRETLEETGE